MKQAVIAGALVMASVLAACTAGGKQPEKLKYAIPPPSETGRADCFHPRDVQGFHVLDRSNLIVYAPGESRAYHVRISPPSVDLRNTERLAFVSSTTSVCGFAGERLVIDNRHGGPRLSIIGVSLLSPEGLEALRARAGLGAAAAPQPSPEASEGGGDGDAD